jgi:hypothetical protein
MIQEEVNYELSHFKKNTPKFMGLLQLSSPRSFSIPVIRCLCNQKHCAAKKQFAGNA